MRSRRTEPPEMTSLVAYGALAARLGERPVSFRLVVEWRHARGSRPHVDRPAGRRARDWPSRNPPDVGRCAARYRLSVGGLSRACSEGKARAPGDSLLTSEVVRHGRTAELLLHARQRPDVGGDPIGALDAAAIVRLGRDPPEEHDREHAEHDSDRAHGTCFGERARAPANRRSGEPDFARSIGSRLTAALSEALCRTRTGDPSLHGRADSSRDAADGAKATAHACKRHAAGAGSAAQRSARTGTHWVAAGARASDGPDGLCAEVSAQYRYSGRRPVRAPSGSAQADQAHRPGAAPAAFRPACPVAADREPARPRRDQRDERQAKL
jgi:hypothetical protein